jgi:hypothetical protein
MKYLFLASLAALTLAGCSSNPGPGQGNQVNIQSNTAGGFDVNKLAPIVKKSTDPATLESAINTAANGITNLDLNNDGNIDYLKVKEEGSNRLKVIDDVDPNQSVDVATISITPNQNNNTAGLNIVTNPDYGGSVYQYHSSFGFTDFLLLSYLMRPHPYYVPMYHYGYYPRTYVRTHVYTSRPNGFASRSNPVYRATPAYRRSLSSPSGSQRSFSRRSSGSGNRSATRSTGFGSGSSSSRSSSFGRSSGSSSRSFGSSRSSSFGRSGRRR